MVMEVEMGVGMVMVMEMVMVVAYPCSRECIDYPVFEREPTYAAFHWSVH